jgi:hypothetical protein
MLVYTNIQHEFRKRHKLTCNEYVLCDMVFYLSSQAESNVPGWCYMSREKMAEEVGLSKQSVLNIIEKMIGAGFLEKNGQTCYLRTTQKWQEAYFTNGKESLPTDNKVVPSGKESLPETGKESLPHNNSSDNNKNNTTSSSKNAEQLSYLLTIPYTKLDAEGFKFICRKIGEEGRLPVGEMNFTPQEMTAFAEHWTSYTNKNELLFQSKSAWSWYNRLANWKKTDQHIDNRLKSIPNEPRPHTHQQHHANHPKGSSNGRQAGADQLANELEQSIRARQRRTGS